MSVCFLLWRVECTSPHHVGEFRGFEVYANNEAPRQAPKRIFNAGFVAVFRYFQRLDLLSLTAFISLSSETTSPAQPCIYVAVALFATTWAAAIYVPRQAATPVRTYLDRGFSDIRTRARARGPGPEPGNPVLFFWENVRPIKVSFFPPFSLLLALTGTAFCDIPLFFCPFH